MGDCIVVFRQCGDSAMVPPLRARYAEERVKERRAAPVGMTGIFGGRQDAEIEERSLAALGMTSCLWWGAGLKLNLNPHP
jgi:hypothetical protein